VQQDGLLLVSLDGEVLADADEEAVPCVRQMVYPHGAMKATVTNKDSALIRSRQRLGKPT